MFYCKQMQRGIGKLNNYYFRMKDMKEHLNLEVVQAFVHRI